MFNPGKQYRCTIIRGKAQNALDDLLPAYARIILDICPCQKDVFIREFDRAMAQYLSSPTKKTIDNHRTEIAGKLFGMWKEDANGLITEAPRTERLIKNRDNPEFFKDIVSRLQFPNGMDAIQTVLNRVEHRINFRPTHFILKLLLEAQQQDTEISKDELAYYVLNALEVLQGAVTVSEVLAKIIENRKARIFLRVESPGKASSYSMQHITELINLMELANLIFQERTRNAIIIRINPGELSVIQYLAKEGEKPPAFNLYNYDLANAEERERMFSDWNSYYCSSDPEAAIFETKIESLIRSEELDCGSNILPLGVDTTLIGEEGERIVFEREKIRVKEFNARLVNKVIYFGKQRGLGYDISSIKAVRGPQAEHAIYIEVKSTKRVTKPDAKIKDQFDLTRNEWIAAEQHKNNYYIYRIYLTNEGVVAFILQDPVALRDSGIIYAEPTKYHIEFEENAGKFVTWEN